MEELKILLEKYWKAETTLEEEKALRRAGMLRYFEEAPELSADFEARVMKALGAAAKTHTHPQAALSIGYRRGWLAAAATVAALVAVLWGTEVKAPTQVPEAPTAIRDTYKTPEQALAEVRKALMSVSIRMNEGRELTEKGMGKINENWKTVIHD